MTNCKPASGHFDDVAVVVGENYVQFGLRDLTVVALNNVDVHDGGPPFTVVGEATALWLNLRHDRSRINTISEVIRVNTPADFIEVVVNHALVNSVELDVHQLDHLDPWAVVAEVIGL